MDFFSPQQAERALAERAENGLLNDPQIRKIQQAIDANRAAGHARMTDLAEGRYDDAQRFGAPALDGFNGQVAAAEALADELAHGLDPKEGRRRFDRLLADHAVSIKQEDRFQEAAVAVVEIEEDLDAANEAFIAAHPDVRDWYEW